MGGAIDSQEDPGRVVFRMLGAKRGDSVGRLGLGAANRLCGKGGRYDRLISTYLKSSVKHRFFEQADGLPEQRVGALQWWQLAQQRAHWKTFVDSISLY